MDSNKKNVVMAEEVLFNTLTGNELNDFNINKVNVFGDGMGVSINALELLLEFKNMDTSKVILSKELH